MGLVIAYNINGLLYGNYGRKNKKKKTPQNINS